VTRPSRHPGKRRAEVFQLRHAGREAVRGSHEHYVIGTCSRVLAHPGSDRGRIAISDDRIRQAVARLGDLLRRVAQPGEAGGVPALRAWSGTRGSPEQDGGKDKCDDDDARELGDRQPEVVRGRLACQQGAECVDGLRDGLVAGEDAEPGRHRGGRDESAAEEDRDDDDRAELLCAQCDGLPVALSQADCGDWGSLPPVITGLGRSAR
jgi:hypothetical protein